MGELLWDRGYHSAPVTALSPDGALLVEFGPLLVRFWNVRSATVIRTLSMRLPAVVSAGFSDDGRTVYALGEDAGLYLLRASDGEALALVRTFGSEGDGYVIGPRSVEFFGSGAMQRATCRVGPLSFPFALCKERFLTKGTIGRIARGEAMPVDP